MIESSFEFEDKTLPLLSNLNLQKLSLTRPSKPLIDMIASYNGYEWLLTENDFMILTHSLTYSHTPNPEMLSHLKSYFF